MVTKPKTNIIENLFRTGAVINVDIKIWSGKKKLDPVELGFDPGEINDKLYTLGSKFLVPHDEIGALENLRYQAKRAIEEHSMEFHFGRFVSNDRIDTLKNLLNDLKSQFDEKVSDLGNRYDAIRQDMIVLWNKEALETAKRSDHNKDFAFTIMTKVESAFLPWSKIAPRFSFVIHEYRDINDVAEEFLRESTKTMVEKMVEFAEMLKEKLGNDKLNEKNLKSVQEFVDGVSDSVKIFGNKDLNAIMESMKTWTEPGMSKKLTDDVKKAMNTVFDGVIRIGSDHIDEIARKSIAGLTNYSRSLDVD